MKTHFVIAMLITWSLGAHATSWLVSPTGTYHFCSEVVNLVENGDTVWIEAATYVDDPQVQWYQNDLYIAGLNGRPRLEAGPTIANDTSNGKGIFVISGSNVHVHNIEFANASVMDHNGAGIRQEGSNLHVSACLFVANEMGILCGNIDFCKTTIEYSEFLNGGSTANPGYQHNVYINHIDTLVFRYNYSHDAIAEGHELKSRAKHNFILYNRISNENTEDSRCIDLPNGGTTVMVGNIIEQGPNSVNSNLIGYGLEGLSNAAVHHLYISNNTIINKKSTGSFIYVSDGTELLYLQNNILAGAATGGVIVGSPLQLDSTSNLITSDISLVLFENADAFNYHLTESSPAIDAGTWDTNVILGASLTPTMEYIYDTQALARGISNIIDQGAYEYGVGIGLEDISEIHELVYPNPANHTIQCWLNQAGEVYISDAQGKVIERRACAAGMQPFDIADLSKGVYYLVIGKSAYRFIKD